MKVRKGRGEVFVIVPTIERIEIWCMSVKWVGELITRNKFYE